MPVAAVLCATALALLGHGFVWTGLVNRLHALKGPRPIIKAITHVCIAIFSALPAVILWQSWSPSGLRSPFEGGGWQVAYLWLCTAVGAASLVVKPWIESSRYDRQTLQAWTAERRDVLKALGGHKPLTWPVGKLMGNLPGNEVLALSIDRKRLALPRLPEELHGLTIAHISDLHMTGRVGREYFEYAIRSVNDLRPDVIAITGDIVEHEACWPWLDATICQLCAPLGVYFVLGNHDDLIDPDRTRETLVDAGLTCLSARWVRAEWNGVPVLLGGNELPWMPAASLEQLSERRPTGSQFRLALCHSPDQFAWCQRADVDLALAGHTHGGQVQLPILGAIGSPSLHGTRYACGVFRQGPTVMHVTRGLGGQTPLRWRCPPEIALLELAPRLAARQPS